MGRMCAQHLWNIYIKMHVNDYDSLPLRHTKTLGKMPFKLASQIRLTPEG